MTHHDNINIAVKLRVAADCFGCSRFLPSETEYGIEFATEALDALPVDLGVQTDGVRQILADPANYDLYQLARWCDGLANRLTERSKVQPRRERKPSKPRRPSISKMIEQAEQAGKPL